MLDFNLKLEDRLILEAPTPQTALDIFKGIWVSKLPDSFFQYKAGDLPLFEDTRIPDSVKFLGSITGKSVLDLGPLEGGQAYVLEKMGAASVISVEANAILYLKCLVMKEILNLQRVHFLCGNVVEYLRNTSKHFDLCVACGILYHMVHPVELLDLLHTKCDQLLIWTHYFDDINSTRNKITSFSSAKPYTYKGEVYTYHKQNYGTGFHNSTYCGGTENYSHWMSRTDIVKALTNFGYSKIHTIYDGDSINGPCILLAVEK